MKQWFTSSSESLLAICITTIGIYIFLVLMTRLSGKRSFSKLSSFDFAITISIGSILASVILSKSVLLLQGVVAIFSIQMLVAYLRRWKIATQIMDNKPTLLMKDGKLI